MAGDITLDKEVFKALAGETRVNVLKSLLERRKTQSELAKELKLAPPTIKDHVEILVHAGLVREVDDGHKWKYIELTVKGKTLLLPQDSRILVLLGTSLVGIATAGYLAYTRYFSQLIPVDSGNGSMMEALTTSAPVPSMAAGVASQAASSPTMNDAGGAIAKSAVDAAPSVAAQMPHVVQIIPSLPFAELGVLVFCLVVFGISVGMWIKKTY